MAWHLTLEILKYTKKILGSGLGLPRPRGPWHLSSLVQWVLRHWSRKLATLLDMSSMISCFVCVFYIVFDTQPDISLNREINTLTESDAKPVWLSGNTVSLDQRSYSTLGPVSAWMGDRLRTGKPTRRRTRQPGLLSLSRWYAEWVLSESWGGGEYRHIAWYISPYPWSCSVGWCLAEELGNVDQRRRTWSGSALGACSRQCAIQIVAFTLLFMAAC